MVLVTGATGLIGTQICKYLVEENIPCKALKRPTSTIDKDLINTVTWIEGDVLDIHSVEEALEDVDTVIHAAALISFYSKEFDRMNEVNVYGTANMINAALRANVDRFVYISSVSALGKAKNKGPANENTLWVKSTDISHYAESKYFAELEVWRGKEEGLSTVILNPSVVLGPGNWNTSITRLFKYVWDEGLFYPGGTFNYLDLRDLAKATLQLMRSHVEGERFILSAGSISYKTFFEMAADAFNKKPPPFKLTPLSAAFVLITERIKSLFSRTPPRVSKESLQFSNVQYDYDNTKIKKYLDFDFTSIKDTIAWTCELLKRDNVNN